MKKYRDHTLKSYLDVLSKKTPVPGGGSAAALVAATGAALISMVTNYSLGKSKSKRIENRIRCILKENEKIRKRLLVLVDLDAEAYLGFVKTRDKSLKIRKAALKKAAQVPAEVCRLCYKAIQLTPFLIKNGNQNLMSDIIVASDMLLAAFNSARTNVEINS